VVLSMPRRRGSLSLPLAAELISEAVGEMNGLDLLLYGSTVEYGRIAGDLDLWLNGTPERVEKASLRLRILERQLSTAIDIASPNAEHPDLAPAVQWYASCEGLLLLGQRPETPPMSEDQVQAAYSSAAEREAQASARTADVLARAGLSSAASFVEAAVRAWVQSFAADRYEARRLKRQPTSVLISRLELMEPVLFRCLSQYSWGSRRVSAALAESLL
jgi:hypothetical protein